MAKDLKSILAGVKSSKIAPPDINDKNTYQWNAKDGVAFIKKHKTETHDDRVGNGDDVYKGKTKKTDKYKFQSDGVYEESEEGELDEKYMGFHALKGHLTQTGAKSPAALAAWIGREKYGKEKFQAAAAKGKKLGEVHVHNNMSETCSHTNEGTYCEMHGTKACPSEDDVNMQKKSKKDSKGREYLTDKKKTMEEGRIEDDAQRRAAKELSAIAAASNKPITKLKPGKKQYNQLKSTGGMFGGARTFAAGVAKRNIEGDIAGAKSVTKAKVGGKLKEEVEYIEEKLTAKDPVSKWIHDFVHSDNPKFDGKSTKERQKMALGAYYGEKRGKKESGSATNTDYTGPGAAGWTTGRHDMGTL